MTSKRKAPDEAITSKPKIVKTDDVLNNNYDLATAQDNHLSNPPLQAKISQYVQPILQSAIPWDQLPATFDHVKKQVDANFLSCTDPTSPVQRTPKSILLHGGQGNGKTGFIHSMCKHFNMKSYQIDTSIKSYLPGQTEITLNYLTTAIINDSKQHPVVSFLDDCEGLTGRSIVSGSESTNTVIVKLKALMRDFVLHKTHVFVIGATGNPWRIHMEDISCLFRLCVHIGLPSLESRVQIFKLGLKNFWHNITDNEWESLAKAADGYSHDDINCLVGDTYQLLRSDLKRAKSWQKMEKDGVDVHVPAFPGAKIVVNGDCGDFTRVHGQPLGLKNLVDQLQTGQNGKPRKKTCAASEQTRHELWNEKAMES